MSVPKFQTGVNITRDEAINQILASIAIEELALSHILNAEGEKLQYILGTLEGSIPPEPATIDQVLQANDSVQSLLEAATYQQMFLKGKMSDALNAASKIGPMPDITIGANGNWFVNGADTGVIASGPAGATPYIGSNGNWWIETTDTGVSAQGVIGPAGPAGVAGPTGPTGPTLTGNAMSYSTTGSQTLIANATGAPIAFANADYSSAGFTANGNPATSFTVSTTGIYLAAYNIQFTTTPSGLLSTTLSVNGTHVTSTVLNAFATPYFRTLNIVSLNSGDIVELVGFTAGYDYATTISGNNATNLTLIQIA